VIVERRNELTDQTAPRLDVVIYWVRLDDYHEALLSTLGEDELRRYAAYRTPDDAARFVLGASLVRAVAAAHLGCAAASVGVQRRCPDCSWPHGRVTLTDCALNMSVSHSGGLVGVACSTQAPLGLDVEVHDTRLDVETLCREVLNSREQALLAAVAPDLRLSLFLQLWTRKEALTKATGQGLRADLKKIDVGHQTTAGWLPDQPEVGASGVSLRDLQADSAHVAALAVLGEWHVDACETDAVPLLRRLREAG
jgi:4'-phosphopantetheinyl transferase